MKSTPNAPNAMATESAKHQIAVDEFQGKRLPTNAMASGLVMHTEVYDSEEDAKADYPESFINPSKWNHAKAIQRGQMIANPDSRPDVRV